MIPPEYACRITFKVVMNNSKIVIMALIIGLAVMTVVLAVVNFTIFGQGVLKNEPDMRTNLTVVGATLWVILIFAGYFAPDLIFGTAGRRIFSRVQHTVSLPPGSDAETLERVVDAIDTDTRAELLSNYMSWLITRYAILEAAGMINAVFFFVTGSIVNLLFVMATLVIMIMAFPTLARFRHWIECLAA